ncbi:class I SAM-dependent methyltransferase [soil metagenome]
MNNLKNAVKKIIPSSLMKWRIRRISAKRQQEFGKKSVAETFGEIYEKNVWGGKAGEFYSGDGSTGENAAKYAETVKNFIAENDIKKVVDLGSGDFRVASKFVSDDFHYTGCDVVPSLVEHLNEKYGNEKIEFRYVNIVEDELPDGDLCLIRQVLQHLSNAEIAKVLQNTTKYKYLIVTEHYPHPQMEVSPNLDIPHGPDMRVRFNSAVVLDKLPFNLQNIAVLLDAEAEGGTRIKTFIIER